jgi:hypothetical protein
MKVTRLYRAIPAVAALMMVAGGVAVADNQGGSYTGDGGRSSKDWQMFKRLDSSRLSQVAYLTGLAEVDGQGEDDAGDPNAKGSANLLQTDERTVCYGFMLTGASTPTAVHVHRGKAKENGPVVLEFTNVPKDAAGSPSGDPGASSGCKVAKTPAELSAMRRIRREPANYYVNIHTDAFPDGAVRGQLGRVWYLSGQ